MKLLLHTCTLSVSLILTGCGPAYTAQSQAKTESKIRSSFGTLKESLARGDRAAIIGQLSPGTMEMFSSARSFGLDPDSVDTDNLSQLEVLIGFQARWLLGVDELAVKSPADLFEWGVQNGIVQIGGLSTVDLANMRTDGNTATAHMATGGTVMTNAVLSFASHDGRWTLEFDKILLASEPQLAAVRAQRSMSKPEMAVAMLEGMYKQPIPSLREFLLAPKIRKQVATLKNEPPSGVYDGVIEALSAGRQSDAEDILDVFVGIHTNDQRLAFAQAACTRSRFNKLKAGWQFRHVLDMDPGTVEGKCARYMLDLDDRKKVDDSFKGLHLLAEENPGNPLVHWMIGVQCRSHYKHTGTTDRSEEGIRAYRRVLEIFDVGPVLVHQTYANLLSEGFQRYEEALVHHRIAVKLEPKAWNYEGLASTLDDLGRYNEAEKAYAKAVELKPDDAVQWYNYGICLKNQGKWEEAITKYKKAIELDPGYYSAHNNLGVALQKCGKLREALAEYEETIRVHPLHKHAYDNAAGVLKALGEPKKAQELLDRKAGIHMQRR